MTTATPRHRARAIAAIGTALLFGAVLCGAGPASAAGSPVTAANHCAVVGAVASSTGYAMPAACVDGPASAPAPAAAAAAGPLGALVSGATGLG